LLSQLKAKGKCDVPIINVYTDFFINNLWGKEEIDFHFLPSEEVKKGLRAQSEIPLQNMMVTGIPVHEEITKTRTFKYPGNRNILIAGGSSGLGNIMDFYNDLKDARHFHYFVLCGKNQKLYEEIKGWELQHVTPIPYISSRTEMNELYERVDAIVTKPGGITVSEALRKNLPIFVHSALPGQEEVNLRYLTERNLVQELKADQSLESQLQAVLQDADKMNTLYNAITAYHKEIEAQTPEELLAVVNWILGEKQTMGLHA
jgi:UDP-N-acetylglucosamine:LPS N-acetylglucosamine transferase